MASKINPFTGELQKISDGSTDTDLTIDGTTLLIDDGVLKSNLLSDDTINIQIDEIRARDIDGLKLFDDSGNGIFVEDGGNIGIGLSNPSVKLDVNGDVKISDDLTVIDKVKIGNVNENPLTTLHILDDSPTIRLSTGGTGNTGGFEISLGSVVNFKGLGNNDYLFSTNNTEKMRITADGNVGIGTTTPGTLLQVNGLTTIGGGIPPNHVILADGIFINGNMSVGIDKLVIFAKDATVGIQKSPHLIIHNEDRTTGNSGLIAWTSDNNTNNEAVYTAIEGIAGARTTGFFAGELAFYTRTTLMDTLSERLRIDSIGNIGIGTISPNALLDIETTGAGVTTSLRIHNASTTNGSSHAQLELRTETAFGGDPHILFTVGGQGNWIMGTDNGDTDAFKISDSTVLATDTRLKIDFLGSVSCPATTGAFIPNRLTTTQRDALTAVNGMIIYNTTLEKFQGRENGAWANLIS